MAEVKVTKIEVYQAADGWRFRVKGGNGEIIAVGEAYVRKEGADAAARALAPDGVPVVEV